MMTIARIITWQMGSLEMRTPTDFRWIVLPFMKSICGKSRME